MWDLTKVFLFHSLATSLVYITIMFNYMSILEGLKVSIDVFNMINE